MGAWGYVNGVAFDFESPGLHETMMMDKGPGHGVNVMEDYGMRLGNMKPTGEKGEGAEKEDQKVENRKSTGVDALGDKQKLRKWFG